MFVWHSFGAVYRVMGELLLTSWYYLANYTLCSADSKYTGSHRKSEGVVEVDVAVNEQRRFGVVWQQPPFTFSHLTTLSSFTQNAEGLERVYAKFTLSSA